MVHAEDDRYRVDGADERTAEAERDGEQELEAVHDAVLDPGEDGADDGEREGAGDEDGHERGDEEVEHVRNMLVQPLLEHAHDEHGDDDGDDVALVALERHVVEAEELDLRNAAGGHDRARRRGGCLDGLAGDGGQPVSGALGTDDLIGGVPEGLDGARDGPGVDERGVVHDHADDATEELVATEDAGGREADEDLQEHEGCVGERMDQDVPGVGVKRTAHGVVDALGEAHEQAGGDDGRDDGDEDVAERLDAALERVGLGGSGCLGLVLRAGGDASQGDELVEDLVDGARAIDDLQLAGGLEAALRANGVVHLGLVHLGVICDYEAQTGGAVCGGDDVPGATDGLEDLLGSLLVVECHVFLSFFPRLTDA